MNFKVESTFGEIDFNKSKLFIKFFVFSLSLLQIVVSNFDLNVVSIVFFVSFSTNLLLNFCFNKKYFIFYFFPTFILFSLNFVFLTGPLFFKSIFLQSIDTNLSSPVLTYLLASIYQIIAIFALLFYSKNNFFFRISKKITNNILFPLKSFEELKISHALFIFIILIFIEFFINFIDGGVNQFSDFGDFWIKTLYRMSILYYLPLILFFKFFYIDKKISKSFFLTIIFIYMLSGFIFALSSNSRTDFFETFIILGTCSIIIKFFIATTKKTFSNILISIALLLVILISSFISNTILNNRTSVFNITPNKLLFLSLKDIKGTPSNLTRFEQGSTYTGNELLDRFVNIKLFDYSLMLSNNVTINRRTEFNNIIFNKYLGIIPQPFINIFDKNFSKAKYVISSGSMLEKSFFGDFQGGKLTQGSYLIELKVIFNSYVLTFFVIFILFILMFIVVQSFQVNTNTEIIFSPLIIVFAPTLFWLTHEDSSSAIIYFLVRGVWEIVFLYYLLLFFKKKNFRNR